MDPRSSTYPIGWIQRDPHLDTIKKLKTKDKDKILKVSREVWLLSYKGTPIRLTADFSSETMENTTS